MRALIMTYGSRGDIMPLAALAAQLRDLGADVRVCAPPDEEFAHLLAGAGVEHVPFGRPVRPLVTGAPPSPGFATEFAAELVAEHFHTVAAAAEGCDVLVASGLMPAGARSVAEKLGIRYVYACFHPFEMPSAHFSPSPRPGPPLSTDAIDMSDSRALWDVDVRKVNALYLGPLNSHRAEIGLPPVDNVRDHVFGDRPWLAADPVLGPWQGLTDLHLVQTGAWILPDVRPLPDDLEQFLDAGTPPVYVGFGSMPMRTATDVARVTVEAVRAQGRRVLVSRGWADLGVVDDADDCFAVGDVNHQALFRRVAAVVHHGGAGTTTTAARAGAPQVVVPQFVDQPHWAARVADLGIGAAHDGPNPTLASLSAALRTALAPETEARAKAVAGTIRPDGAAVAAKMLLDTANSAPLSREEISGIAHADHPIKAPLDDESVGRLLGHGLPRGDERVLDLGCGTAEWLLRALATRPRLHAEGVDVSEVALRQARRTASALGVEGRMVLHHREAADFTSPQPFDLVISVGATHAFGGLLPTLAAAREHLAPGGRVLIGESFWDRDPSAAAVEAFGDLADLATTVDHVVADGWTPVHGHVSTRSELDAYEWACWGSLASWALDHPADPAGTQALKAATAARSQWLHGYRDSFGFLCLVLRRTPDTTEK
ncbi:hypothetical protein GCM10009730_50480 [Streptomyces albidochromogenes]